MYSNRSSLSKGSLESIFDFLQIYTYSRCIHQMNGSSYLSRFIIQQPDIFNIREVESEEGEYSARNNLNDLEDQNFTDQEDNAKAGNTQHNKETEDSLKQTAYFSEEESQYFENVNHINVMGGDRGERGDVGESQSLKSKLLMKLIREKTKKKGEIGVTGNGKMEQKMEEDISYLKKLRRHCNLR